MSALPKLNATPKHEMVIPSTGKTVMFRPYLVKEEKILMMAFESQDEKTAMKAMLDTIDACVEGDYVKSKLTTFDIEYMFTQIRGKSVGESIEVKTKCSECETEQPIRLLSFITSYSCTLNVLLMEFPKTLLINLFLSNLVILVSFIVNVDWLAVNLLINSALVEILFPKPELEIILIPSK